MNDAIPPLAALLIRARGGLSVDALAYKAGVSGNSIRNAESGKLPREATLRAILRAAKPVADLRAEITAAFDRERAVVNERKAAARLARVAK